MFKRNLRKSLLRRDLPLASVTNILGSDAALVQSTRADFEIDRGLDSRHLGAAIELSTTAWRVMVMAMADHLAPY